MPVSYMEIDLRAFRHNLRVIRSHLKNVPALAVIKANAYGHGAVECLRVALEEGCVGAAVARVEEGRVVRASGFDCPVYVLGLPLPEEMSVGVNEELILPVDDTTNLEALETAASTLKKMVEVMLPIDTGMNRIGTHAKDLPAFLEKLNIPTCIFMGCLPTWQQLMQKIRVKRINNWQNLKRPFPLCRHWRI